MEVIKNKRVSDMLGIRWENWVEKNNVGVHWKRKHLPQPLVTLSVGGDGTEYEGRWDESTVSCVMCFFQEKKVSCLIGYKVVSPFFIRNTLMPPKATILDQPLCPTTITLFSSSEK